MIRALQYLLAVSLAGAIITALIAAPTSSQIDIISTSGQSPASSNPEQSKPLAKNVTATVESAMSRDVGGGVVSATPIGQEPLERVEALQPTEMSEPSKARPSAFEPQFLRWRLIYNSVASSAGILQSGDMAVVLSGIDVVSVDETCKTSAGDSWPCGMVARTAFRNYLQGRALNCHLPDVTHEKAVVAECLLQGQDPAAWLVERGWARSHDDGQLKELAALAKASGRGIHGQPPAGVEVTRP